MEHIVTKVEKQELEITYIKKTLDELVEQNKIQNKQLSKISESISKQEIILEKVSNLDDKYTDAIKRVHFRIDEQLKICEERIAENKMNIEKILNRKNEVCPKHDILEKDIEILKKQQEKHAKIFWWVSTAIIGLIITAVIKSVLK